MDDFGLTWKKSTCSGDGGHANCVEVAWRKSSRSGQGSNGACVEVAWRKSSHSTTGTNDNCVEVAPQPLASLVRDSKNPAAVPLAFPTATWNTFLASL